MFGSEVRAQLSHLGNYEVREFKFCLEMQVTELSHDAWHA